MSDDTIKRLNDERFVLNEKVRFLERRLADVENSLELSEKRARDYRLLLGKYVLYVGDEDVMWAADWPEWAKGAHVDLTESDEKALSFMALEYLLQSK